jgi:hypothetical protein
MPSCDWRPRGNDRIEYPEYLYQKMYQFSVNIIVHLARLVDKPEDRGFQEISGMEGDAIILRIFSPDRSG